MSNSNSAESYCGDITVSYVEVVDTATTERRIPSTTLTTTANSGSTTIGYYGGTTTSVGSLNSNVIGISCTPNYCYKCGQQYYGYSHYCWGTALTWSGTTYTPGEYWHNADKASFVELDVAGYDPTTIDVKVEGRKITVTAERTFHNGSKTNYTRTLVLPELSDGAGVTASYKHGVLLLEIPFDKAKKRTVPVNILGQKKSKG